MPSLDDVIAFGDRPDPRQVSYDSAVITALQEDGTVNLMYRDARLPGVPRLASYAAAKGDTVAVAVTESGILVLGKYSGDLNLTSPGTQIAPTGLSAYRAGGQAGAFIVQGTEEAGEPDYSSIWVYGTAIRSRLASSFTSVRVYLARDKETGTEERVAAVLYTHAYQTLPSTTPVLSNRTVGPMLEPGEGTWWQLPTAMTNALKNGPAYGLGILDSGPDVYIQLTSSSGRVAVN